MEYSLHAPTSEPQWQGNFSHRTTRTPYHCSLHSNNVFWDTYRQYTPTRIFFSKPNQSLQSYEPTCVCVCRRNLTAGRNLIVNFECSRFSVPPCITSIGTCLICSISYFSLCSRWKICATEGCNRSFSQWWQLLNMISRWTQYIIDAYIAFYSSQIYMILFLMKLRISVNVKDVVKNFKKCICIVWCMCICRGVETNLIVKYYVWVCLCQN
jgi:hypothetical protein